MNIVVCQTDIAWENKAANFTKVRRLLAEPPPPEGSLVVLPEMFATGFSMNTEAVRQGNPPETEVFLAELAVSLKSAVLGGTVGNNGEGERARNEAVAFGADGRLLARYAKIHTFGPGDESRYYEPGRETAVFEWGGFTVMPVICYDLRFPEIFRAGLRRGVTLFAVIASWPAVREPHWLTLLSARALENQAFVAGVNRCGSDPHLAYGGRSRIIDPNGVVLADAGTGEGLLSVRIEPEQVACCRKQFPVLRDIRQDWQ